MAVRSVNRVFAATLYCRWSPVIILFGFPLNASLGRTKMSTGTATHPHVHSNLKATLNHNESHFKPHVFPQIFQV